MRVLDVDGRKELEGQKGIEVITAFKNGWQILGFIAQGVMADQKCRSSLWPLTFQSSCSINLISHPLNYKTAVKKQLEKEQDKNQPTNKTKNEKKNKNT